MPLLELKKKIQDKSARIAVIGLGYVGLPVACEFARAGFNVIGIDILEERIQKINQGVSPIEGNEPGLDDLLSDMVSGGKLRATTDYQDLTDQDIILIDVETPVDENHQPQYLALRAVLKDLGPVLKSGALVVVESTIAPLTMRDLVLPMLEESSGKKLNEGFYLGNCPERVMPGRLLQNLRYVSRVVGGMTPETAEVMVLLYKNVVEADLDPTDCITAELVKTTENAFRDVNIAFANEVALICEAAGGDVWKVRDLVNKSPGRNMHLPGAGVGGHCIPKDPWLLVANIQDVYQPRLIPTARAINDQMPIHVAERVIKALGEENIEVDKARVAVLGYAYLENSDDIRNSPTIDLVAKLENLGARVLIHDPHVDNFKGSIEEVTKGCHAVVIMVKHDEYQGLDLMKLRSNLDTPIMVDGRKTVNAVDAVDLGFKFYSIGN